MRVETLMNYRAGRAVRGLAARSAVIPFGHRTAAFSLVVAFFALLKKAWSGLRPPPTIPQPDLIALLWPWFAMNFLLGQLFFKGIVFAMAEKNRAD